MTAGEAPGDGVANLDWAGDWAAFTEAVDMARPIWLGWRKQKGRASRAALIRTRQRSVIATVRAREH